MVGRLVLPLVAVVAVVGCIGAYDLKPPPVPSTTRTPTIVGVIAGREPDGVTYRLEDGTTVDVGGPNSSAVPAAQFGQPYASDDSLLLFGEDAEGASTPRAGRATSRDASRSTARATSTPAGSTTRTGSSCRSPRTSS